MHNKPEDEKYVQTLCALPFFFFASRAVLLVGSKKKKEQKRSLSVALRATNNGEEEDLKHFLIISLPHCLGCLGLFLDVKKSAVLPFSRNGSVECNLLYRAQPLTVSYLKCHSVLYD